MRMYKLGIVAFALATCTGCQSDSPTADRKESQKTGVEFDKKVLPTEGGSKAFAVINPTEGNEVVGAITFTKEEGGVRIVADVGGLKPGKHGFHVHEHGDCSAPDASSAGGHFNPTGMPHGGPESSERHVGDLGNLEANEYGFAHYDRLDSILQLKGVHSIVGKSIVIHAGEDDLVSQPTGNSGARVACGKIVSLEE